MCRLPARGLGSFLTAAAIVVAFPSVLVGQHDAAERTGDGASASEAAEASVRPGFKTLRFEEDWSGFVPDVDGDFWDPAKRLELSEDGDVWASFGGEFRLRVESWNNFGFANSNDDTFLLGRVLLHSDVHVGKNLRFFVEGISALSTDRDLPGGRSPLYVNELDLQNAFADIIFPTEEGPTFTVRVGRQQFLFGKQRLVSPLPWANSKRTWDAARLIVTLEDWRIDAFYSRFVATQKYEFDDWRAGADFYGAYAAGKIDLGENRFDLDLYALGLARDNVAFNGTAGDEERITLGARFGGVIDGTGLDFDLEGAYQLGEVGRGDVSAYAIAAVLGYTIPDTDLAPRFHIGFDYASGDNNPGDADVETFNQLFPLGHAYLGYVDVVGRQNIIDLSGGFSIKPVDGLTLKINGHLFWRASTDDALYNAGGGVVRAGNLSNESEVGQEIDLVATYRLDRHLVLEAGYSHFFAGDFIEDSGPGEDIDWVYLQATYTF